MPRNPSIVPPAGALPDFEGCSVMRSRVKITKAGDGLSDALDVAPAALHHGADVYFVLHGTVRQVNHVPFDTLGTELVRVHTIDTVEITQVDRDAVEGMLHAAYDRVRKARAALTGQDSLDDALDGNKEDDDGSGSRPDAD